MSILFLERVGRKQSRRGGDKSRVSLCGPNCCRNLLGTGHLSRDRCATYDTYGQIYRKSYHGNVQRTENSCVEERSLEACKGPGYGVRVRDHCHGVTLSVEVPCPPGVTVIFHLPRSSY